MSICECTKGFLFFYFFSRIAYTYTTQIITSNYVHEWRTSRKYTTIVLVGQAYLFGRMKEDEKCDYDHKLIDDSSAQGGDKDNYSVGEFKHVQGCCHRDRIDAITR